MSKSVEELAKEVVDSFDHYIRNPGARVVQAKDLRNEMLEFLNKEVIRAILERESGLCNQQMTQALRD